MPKEISKFVCQNCGTAYSKWQGQCLQCGQWNCLVEEMLPAVKKKAKASDWQEKMMSYSEVKPLKGSKNRFLTGIGELDRVLGGGLVPGSVLLIGGEPGIGKSTLLTQLILKLTPQISKAKTKSVQGFGKIFYVCGEESPQQISLRISRIIDNEQKNKKGDSGKISDKKWGKDIVFITTTNVDEILELIRAQKPSLIIVDSIQTVYTPDLTGASGSVGQIRESADRFTQLAKAFNIPLFLVGHVTKDGTIAGPKVLEHIVDTVLELSGERTGQLRLLRALKNRFGATDEVGIFKFEDFGLVEVSNPSEMLIENQEQAVPGSTIACLLEGTRPLLVEVQALVINSQLAMPRRVGRGINLSRIQILSAVLQKHCRLPLGSTDVFLSAAGGFTIKEPAVDLALAVAMVSSLKNKKLLKKTVFIGELGLLGEIRSVPYLDRRIKEAKRLGFEQIISRKTHRTVKEVLKNLNLI